MSEILKEASEARRYGIALQHLEYSGTLVQQLLKHSNKLEVIYSKLQNLRSRDVSDDAAFAKFYSILDPMQAWYKQAEAAVQG